MTLSSKPWKSITLKWVIVELRFLQWKRITWSVSRGVSQTQWEGNLMLAQWRQAGRFWLLKGSMILIRINDQRVWSSSIIIHDGRFWFWFLGQEVMVVSFGAVTMVLKREHGPGSQEIWKHGSIWHSSLVNAVKVDAELTRHLKVLEPFYMFPVPNNCLIHGYRSETLNIE